MDGEIQQTIVKLFITWIYIFLNIFIDKVKINVMDYYYCIIKSVIRMRIELAVKRVFSKPRGYDKWRKILSESSSDVGSIFP